MLESKYLNFSTTRNPDEADQSGILHIPGLNGTMRREIAAQTFSISIFHWPTFSRLLILSHDCQGTKQDSCHLFRSGHDGTQERATRLTPTSRAMAASTWELWEVWCPLTFSDPWPHHWEGSQKNSCHSFSWWLPGTGEKREEKAETPEEHTVAEIGG